MTALLFWFGVVGLLFDWRYMRKGGQRPTRDEKRYLAAAVFVCVLAFVVLALLGANAGGLGNLAALLSAVVLASWSGRRMLIRRKNPISRGL